MSAALLNPPTKPRSDSTLKTKSDELQEEIFKESRTKSIKELCEWLAKERHTKTSPAAMCRFLGWFGTYRQGTRNEGANEALNDLGKTPGQFFQDTALDQQDMVAWHNAERIALRRERLELDREKFRRSHSEYIVNTCNNPQIGAAARKKGVSYAHKVKEVDTIMFGTNGSDESKKSPDSPPHPNPLPQGGEGILVSNAQSPGSAGNIQHPVEAGKGGKGEEEKTGIGANSGVQPTTFNLQPSTTTKAPTSNGQPSQNGGAHGVTHPTENLEPATCNVQPAPARPPLEAAGSLSPEEATKVVEAAFIKSKKNGLRVPKRLEVAALRAYLTGKAISWYNNKKFRKETMQPPALDPRLDQASPWHGLWKKLEEK
jgi:hypothetical protein